MKKINDMKNRIYLFLIMIAVTLGAISCGDEIIHKPAPVASFTVNKTEVALGEELVIVNNSSNAVSYVWSFGDGTTSKEVAPRKKYLAEGNYTLTLAATGLGGVHLSTQMITVGKPAPVASFTMSATEVGVEEPITFTNTSLNGTSFVWDFGDGATSTETSPSKGYTEPGTYTVTLTATNSTGTHTTSATVTVVVKNAYYIYFISTSAEKIQKYYSFTGEVTDVLDIAGKSGPSLAYDPAVGKMFWSDFEAGGKIWKANLDGTEVELVTEFDGDAYQISLDTQNELIYFAEDANTGTSSYIKSVKYDGSDVKIIATSAIEDLFRAVTIDVGRNTIFYHDAEASIYYKANLDGSNVVELVTEGYGYVMEADRINQTVYYNDYQNDKLLRMNYDGTNIVTISSPETARMYGIAIDNEDNKLYWSSGNTLKVSDLDGGNVVTLKEGLATPRGIFLIKED
jgi:PKD repeat protein